MGSWSISIHGHGIHDNGLAEDADSLLRKFVAELRGLGHVVHGAHFTAGASQDLTTEETVKPFSADVPAEPQAAPVLPEPAPGPLPEGVPVAEPASADPAS